ncbi:2-dehydro-3-deoxygalactonokinase [Roseateles noduli]|uniref:2-dehydro-3-deoxygalactonokinase n=1 Tax=Roseateles noduli TaxID=2052484 RepID=UPI003D657194
MSRDVEDRAGSPASSTASIASSAPAPGPTDTVGINWGSTNFRACRIAPSGEVSAEWSRPAGVTGLGRDGMAATIAALRAQWPDLDTLRVYASGMIGSNIGWAEAPYAAAPATLADIAARLVPARIGTTDLRIVPGVCCRRVFDDGPDVMRGEEMELFGFAAANPRWSGLIALPGTHTKWARFESGRIVDFFTSMSGEMFDRLTTAGLLASIVDGPAVDGPAFHEGVATGRRRQLGLSTALFGARARVMQARLSKADAASYLRGLLIGSEIADALAVLPDLRAAVVPLVGNGPLCQLYAAALRAEDIESRFVDSRHACVSGFLHLRASEE